MHRQGMNDFLQWLNDAQTKNDEDGIVCPKVELVLIDHSTGYGLFAKEDAKQNEILIKIPHRFLITAFFVANIPEYAQIIQQFRLEPSEILALFFAFERVYFERCFCEHNMMEWTMEKPHGFEQFLKRRKDRLIEDGMTADTFWWKFYLGALPNEFGTPLFKNYLKEDGKHLIRGIAAQLPQQIKEKLLGQLAEMKALEKKLFQIVASFGVGGQDEEFLSKKIASTHLDNDCADGEHSEGDDRINSAFWREIFCWAWHIVNTRCVFMEGVPFHPLVDLPKENDELTKSSHQKLPNRRFSTNKKKKESDNFGGSLAIVPFMDMINHSPNAQCIPMFDKKSHSYIVRTEHHTVRAGQQLFVCYGAHDNARLWIEYGFQMEDNPFNRVNIPIELFIALAERCGARVNSTRREILAKAGLPWINWSQFIFAAIEDENEIGETKEMDLLSAILQRLESALSARREECGDDEVRSFWADQILILQRMLGNLKKE